MTILDIEPSAPERSQHERSSITAGQLGRNRHIAVIAASVLLGVLSWLPSGSINWARWIVVTLVAYCVCVYAVARIIEFRIQ